MGGRRRARSEIKVSCTTVPTEWLLNSVLTLQILSRSTTATPSSDRPVFARMVFRRLVEEVFLLRASDLGGELFCWFGSALSLN